MHRKSGNIVNQLTHRIGQRFSSKSSIIYDSIHKMQSIRKHWLDTNAKVGLVMTMGALHEGHLDLVRAAKNVNDKVAVSIFVNPTQFGPNEDFTRYPRTLDSDVAKLLTVNADAVFAPPSEEMYGNSDGGTFVMVQGIDQTAEGRARPGHFQGVATIVTKVINIIQPHQAFFGQKDGMQCIVVGRAVRELNLNTTVVICPTKRHQDGLAMSSRNMYLSAAERNAAPALYRALYHTQLMFVDGKERDVSKLKQRAFDTLSKESLIRVTGPKSYISVSNSLTGQELYEVIPVNVVPMLSLAVDLGTTRLIDNCFLGDVTSTPIVT